MSMASSWLHAPIAFAGVSGFAAMLLAIAAYIAYRGVTSSWCAALQSRTQ